MIPQFANKSELFTWLKANKDLLIQAKKAERKKADCVYYVNYGTPKVVDKSENLLSEDITKLQIKVVINTTNLMDSHDDVHLPGIWNKSLNDRKSFYLVQEHQMKFDKVISDKVQAKAVDMAWSELGQPYSGKTQALVFDAELEIEDNPYMFNKYRKGKVKNHSVGMRYVKIQLAVNSEDKFFREEKDAWDKYYSEIANKEQADDKGYFFAVTEAKIIEGSAVLAGSNHVTPTLQVSEPLKSTHEHIEPPTSTQKIDWNLILTSLKKQ